MVNNISKIFVMTIFLLIISSTSSAAEILATVDRNPIPLGESFLFTLDATGSVDKDPDFSELEKTFRILNPGKSSNISIVNGSVTRKTIWTMQLLAEKPGKYIIPAINFGKDNSDPIVINILEASVQQNNNQSPEIYFEISVDKDKSYVQQQIVYTMKLFLRIELANPRLSEPVSQDGQAIITKLGEDSKKNITLNGIAYTVIERRYAIFPQKSGKLTISSLNFEAQAVSQNRQRSYFNFDRFYQQGTVKRIQSKAIAIEVDGIPLEFSKKFPDATWLAVDNLSISETWSGDTKSFISGEPMTRTISLTVQNISATQLPDINFSAQKHIKIYPDVPVTAEQSNVKGLIANKQFKTALLPTKLGRHTLPEIAIPWWNTNTDKLEVSRLAAHTINVEANKEQSIAENEMSQLKSKSDSSLSQLRDNANSNQSQDNNVNPDTNFSNILSTRLWLAITASMAVLWLITIFILLSTRRKLKTVILNNKNETVRTTAPETISIKQVKTACIGNDSQACSQILVRWANSQTADGTFTNLASLLPFVDKDLRHAIECLQQHLYSKNSSEWQGSKLWSAFDSNPPQFKTQNNSKSLKPVLASLYAKYQ